MTTTAKELSKLGLRKPHNCPDDHEVKLYGGGALVFDDFCKLRLHVRNRLDSPRQQPRLDYLWRTRETLNARPMTNLAELHATRNARGSTNKVWKGW